MSDLITFVPLTDTMRDVLYWLASDYHGQPGEAEKHFSTNAITRVVKAGYAERVSTTEHPKRHARITPLGRYASQFTQEHDYSFGKRYLGGSPVAGLGGSYGTTIRCRCRWADQTNESPQKGGRTQLKARHVEHMRTQFTPPQEVGA